MLFSTTVAPSCNLTNEVADTVRGAALGICYEDIPTDGTEDKTLTLNVGSAIPWAADAK